MCGIVGAMSFTNDFNITASYINRMRETMIHRGPDGAGTWVAGDGRVGLGHRRLSIIDLTNAACQPMCNEDETLWISFNGEIYNHAEIRRQLDQTGTHIWKTHHSDTEVILHAFEEWGIDCLNKFRGMFAIALWDARRRELWLIRDRIGIKPLYYSIHHGRITFASEIKALLQDPSQERRVDDEAFFHYLSFLTTPAPSTLFYGIKKIPGGTWVRVTEEGKVYEERYWDVWDHTLSLEGVSETEIAERLLDELRTAVKLRKVSDVPVGVFLSGGIDSSTNAALFSEGEIRPVKTFTIGYQGEFQSYQNEFHYARNMAAKVGAAHYELVLTVDDLIDFLPRMVELQDEPIADSTCIPIYYISKLARDNGVVVCQVGEGADELFWGYPWWKTALSFQYLCDFPYLDFIKKMGLAGLKVINKTNSRYYEWLRRSLKGRPVFWGGAEAFYEIRKRNLLSPEYQKKLAGLDSWETIAPIYQRFKAKAGVHGSHLNWMSYLDLNLRLPELLLMKVDKMSMGVGLEGRVPFLDHKVVELALSIPEAIKTKNGVLKYILKKAVYGVIPAELIERQKQGFTVPVYEWFFDKLGDEIRRELEQFCQQTDFLNYSEIKKLLDGGFAYQVWYIFNFALWWKKYLA